MAGEKIARGADARRGGRPRSARLAGGRPGDGHAGGAGRAARFAGGALGVLCAAALAVTLVFAGLLACLAPVTTRLLAQATSLEDVSPYSRDELVDLAVATRAYTVGSLDLDGLRRAEQDALDAARADGRVPAGADAASDQLALPADALAHLDDCRAVLDVALPVLACVAAGAVALGVACALLGGWRARGRRRLGAALVGGGATVLAAFGLLGAWALLDFKGLFAVFHGLFFQEGTWKFPWDSLLICMYPDAFWTGMAAVWVAVAALLGAACAAAGAVLLCGPRADRATMGGA